MRGARNNILAGILVLASIIAAIVVVVLLGGVWERRGLRDYALRFTLEEGVPALDEGSSVLVGGKKQGIVKAIEFEPSDDGAVKAILVTVSIKRGIELRRGSQAMLISPLLGGSSTINFPTVGTGPPIAAGDIIEADLSPPTLLAQAGYGPEQKEQVQRIIRNVAEASEKINVTLDEARAVVGKVDPVVTDVRDKWPTWSGRFDSITQNLDTTLARGPELADDLEQTLADIRAVIEENRPNILSVTDDAKAVLERVRGEFSDKVSALLDKGKDAIDSGADALARADALLIELTPTIRRGMTNFRLASDQLSAMMAEVRQSPWRLLYRPERRETEFELLYDSARTYATAVSDLRSAGDSLKGLAEGAQKWNAPGSEALRAEQIKALSDQLERAFDQYKQAENELLRQIMLLSEGK